MLRTECNYLLEIRPFCFIADMATLGFDSTTALASCGRIELRRPPLSLALRQWLAFILVATWAVDHLAVSDDQ